MKKERAAYDKARKETFGYKTVQQKWGTGSAIQQGIQAATATVQGLAGAACNSLWNQPDLF